MVDCLLLLPTTRRTRRAMISYLFVRTTAMDMMMNGWMVVTKYSTQQPETLVDFPTNYNSFLPKKIRIFKHCSGLCVLGYPNSKLRLLNNCCGKKSNCCKSFSMNHNFQVDIAIIRNATNTCVHDYYFILAIPKRGEIHIA